MSNVYTVFFANIVPSIPDSFIQSILRQFGDMKNYLRAINSHGEYLDFLFVDFSELSEVLKALKIGPMIEIQGKRWEVRIDNSVEDSLRDYQGKLELKSNYSEKNEALKYQNIYDHIRRHIESLDLPEYIPKIKGVIESPNDSAREQEYYHYLLDCKAEDDYFDSLFKEMHMNYKFDEYSRLDQINEAKNYVKNTDERINREKFLKEWSFPDLSLDDVNNPEIVEKLNQYMKYKESRKNLLIEESEIG